MKKWIKVNDLSSSQCSFNKNISFETWILKPDLCFFSAACIDTKGTITVEGVNDAETRNKKLIFKNKAPFRSCILKINNTVIDNAEDLHIAMAM